VPLLSCILLFRLSHDTPSLEAVKRHIETKHNRNFRVCSFCLKRCRVDYLTQHEARYACKYRQRVRLHSFDSTVMVQKQSRPHLAESDSSPPSENDTLRAPIATLLEIRDDGYVSLKERTLDVRLAADPVSRFATFRKDQRHSVLKGSTYDSSSFEHNQKRS
jgi:hypothetical protein